MLFQEGAGVGSSNNFKIKWTALDNKVPTEEMVNITIKTISPPEYYIQNIRNGHFLILIPTEIIYMRYII